MVLDARAFYDPERSADTKWLIGTHPTIIARLLDNKGLAAGPPETVHLLEESPAKVAPAKPATKSATAARSKPAAKPRAKTAAEAGTRPKAPPRPRTKASAPTVPEPVGPDMATPPAPEKRKRAAAKPKAE
jgi:hypothetical protein